MSDKDNILNIAHRLNAGHGWGLSGRQLEALAEEAMPHIGPGCGDVQAVETVLANYYLYAGTVRAITDPGASPAEREAAAGQWNAYLRKVAAKVCWRSPLGGYDVDDVVQLSWVNILRGARTFQYKCKLETWVFQVVVNTHLGLQRGSARRREDLWDGAEKPGLSTRDRTAPDPLGIIIGSEDREEIRAVVRNCLLEVAATRRRLGQWIRDYPQGLNSLAVNVIKAIAGEISQHDLAVRYGWPEPTVSRIIKDLIESVKTNLA